MGIMGGDVMGNKEKEVGKPKKGEVSGREIRGRDVEEIRGWDVGDMRKGEWGGIRDWKLEGMKGGAEGKV